MTDELPGSVRRGYALGSVATGTFGTVPGLLLLPYLTDTLGIAAVVAGFIVFLPKAWDVILNPIAGRISDKSSSPRGRRRPFLLWGGLTLAAFFALLFAGPTDSGLIGGIYVVVIFLACATAYAFFQVPYVAMPAEMTLDYGERTKLMTWRVAVLALAILISGATAPILVNAYGGDPSVAGYRTMGVFIALVLVIGTLGAYFGTAKAPEFTTQTPTGSLRDQLRLVAGAHDFRILLLTFVIQALGIGAMLAGVAYVAKDLLNNPGAASIIFVAFVGPALIFAPLWERYARTRGKRSGYFASSWFLVAGAFGLFFAHNGMAVAVYLAAALVGIGYAGAQVFPIAMLPDVAAHDAKTTGENRIGVFTGVWTAGETLGLALGPGVFAVILAIGGYVSSGKAVAVAQPDSALLAIAVGFSLIPAVLIAISLLVLRRYDLDKKLDPHAA